MSRVSEPTTFGALVQLWRDKAKTLRTYAAGQQATVLEACADALEASLEQALQQPLTLAEAAELSGYSSDHLGRLVREGTIPNAGRHGAPRIARGDVPRKSGNVASAATGSDLSRTQIVRAAISEGAA